MSGKFYGAGEFNPWLISTQMVVMQSLFYFCFIVLTACSDWIIGAPQSLSQFFRFEDYTWSSSPGCALALSLLLTSLVMAVALRYVVERAKKCWDFVATYHLLHLAITWFINGFPRALHWWILNVVAAVVALVLGEYICIQGELKEIKINRLPGIAV
mmetsp:Transcript_72451/g.125623  ORF Transcript_72451/g.125623 Transcript_72451/m.125623 type:complete len:157 (+) Transcript_72451:157-627(+)